MTHGDQAKAKTAKSSQASADKKSSKSGKAGGKEAGAGGKGQIPLKKPQAGAEKGSSASAKEAGNGGKAGKARPVAADAGATSGFSNAAVAAAFERALKKYPNAFRKLTD